MFRQKLIFTVQVYKGMHDTSRYLPSETSTSRQSQTVFQKINSHLDQRKKNENRVDFESFCFGNVMH